MSSLLLALGLVIEALIPSPAKRDSLKDLTEVKRELQVGASCVDDVPSGVPRARRSCADVQAHLEQINGLIALARTPEGAKRLELTPNQWSFDFGVVPQGQTATATIIVTNKADFPQTMRAGYPRISNVWDAEPFVIESTTCMKPIPSQGSCAVDISFTPTRSSRTHGTFYAWTVENGDFAFLTLFGTDGLDHLYNIEIAPQNIYNFPVLAVGAHADQRFVVRNIGTAPLTFRAGQPRLLDSLLAQAYSVLYQDCPTVLPAGAECAIDVRFTPPSAGNFYGYINALTEERHSTPVSMVAGSGEDGYRYELTSDPSELIFPRTPVGETAVLPVSVRNTGNAAVTLSMVPFVSSNGDTAVLEIEGNGCIGSIAPQGFCTLNLVFAPSQSVLYTGRLYVPVNEYSPAFTWPVQMDASETLPPQIFDSGFEVVPAN